jgi:predicted short-subunit dehydrogenase-like oxidoreductase (DUF2520 family)
MTKTKYNCVIIGAGKISHSIVPALLKSGYNISQVISRKISSAKKLANQNKIKNYSDSLKSISKEVNVFLLTVPDGEIRKVANDLSRTRKDFSECFVIHFSGVETIHSLISLKKKGCKTGSLHIIRPFPSKNIVGLKNSPVSIESDDNQTLDFLIQLCKKLKLKPHRISSENKVLQHIAAVHSSNFLVGNLFNAFSLISSKNILPKNILMGTTQSALNNVFKLSPSKALSGPVDRGDFFTVKKHIEAIDDKINKSKGKKEIQLLKISYVIQSLGLLEIAKVKYGSLSKDHLKIEKFLKGEFRKIKTRL